MSRIVYVNGEYLAEENAKISIFDRGFLFADGVYEVSSVINGRLVDNQAHMARLKRSMDELDIQHPATAEDIETVQKRLIEKNQLQEGVVYIQVTRGVADREFLYPENTQPSMAMFTQKKSLRESPLAKRGMSIITVPDIRWQRRDIKTVALLAASMAKMQAKAAEADDAWFVEQGFITEGSSNNAFIVTQEGTIVTRHLGNEILAGITRKVVLRLSEEEGISIEERPFTVAEALVAAEAFVTASSSFVTAVVSIDGHQINHGVPGPVTQKLRDIYIQEALKR